MKDVIFFGSLGKNDSVFGFSLPLQQGVVKFFVVLQTSKQGDQKLLFLKIPQDEHFSLLIAVGINRQSPVKTPDIKTSK